MKASIINLAALSSSARDTKNDIAVLRVPWEISRLNTVSFHDGAFRIGEEVIVAGLPLAGIVASSLNLTTGTVSATAGLEDNPNQYTVTAPSQPGNRGGPLLDNKGNLVGIMVSQLKSEIAQNVKFAVKFHVIRDFLKNNNIEFQTADSSSTKMTTAEIADKAKLFTVSIYCYRNNVSSREKTEPESAPSSPSPPPPPTRPTGYWSTDVADLDDGRSLGLAVTRNVGVYALLAKPTWSIPQGVRVAARVQIDNYYPLSGPGTAFPGFPNTIAIRVHPQFYSALVYQMIEGWWATVSFTGNEPPWRVSLWGVKAAWPTFLQCARRVSPAFVGQLYNQDTQPW